jgi:hypothetical protein
MRSFAPVARVAPTFSCLRFVCDLFALKSVGRLQLYTCTNPTTLRMSVSSLTQDALRVYTTDGLNCNEIASMSSAGASIITQDLQVHLDAGNPASYTPGSSLWVDLRSGLEFQLVGGPLYSPSYGGSLYFNRNAGPQHARSLRDQPVATPRFTVEAWLFVLDTYMYSAVVTQLTYASSTSYFLGSGGSGIFCINQQACTSPMLTLTPNRWYHFAQTYDGSRLRGFVNGVFTQSSDFNGNMYWSSSAPILLMRHPESESLFMSGNLSVVRIYNRSLSDAEVVQNYNSESLRFGVSPQPTMNCVFCLPFYKILFSFVLFIFILFLFYCFQFLFIPVGFLPGQSCSSDSSICQLTGFRTVRSPSCFAVCF